MAKDDGKLTGQKEADYLTEHERKRTEKKSFRNSF